MFGDDVDLGAPNFGWERPVDAREVAACQRVGVEQGEVTHTEAHQLFGDGRAGAAAADDDNPQVTEDLLNLGAEGADVAIEVFGERGYLVQPVSDQGESPAGDPQPVDVGPLIGGLDVAAEPQLPA